MNDQLPPSPSKLRSRIMRSWPFHAYVLIGASTGLSTLVLPTNALLVINALCVLAAIIITGVWIVVLQRGNANQEQTALLVASQLYQEGYLAGLSGYRGEIQASAAQFRRQVAPYVLATVLLLALGRLWPDLWIRASSIALTCAYLGSALAANYAESVRADTILSIAATESA